MSSLLKRTLAELPADAATTTTTAAAALRDKALKYLDKLQMVSRMGYIRYRLGYIGCITDSSLIATIAASTVTSTIDGYDSGRTADDAGGGGGLGPAQARRREDRGESQGRESVLERGE